MLQSWHNFFYVAAEPGGAVSVDKPPLGLWLQAISAYFLGINGFAVVLPQIIAGLLSVAVVYHLARRSFSVVAGWVAALALAVTPIVVATDRNNTMDSTLILTLLLAAWAFIKATESGRRRYLLLGAVLVGLGFNIKMLQAYLPLPAFYALYFLGASQSVRRKLVNLTLATAVLLAVSLSWAVAVELTPADQRPYVGSSGNNSVLNLMLGYNGVQRLTGVGGGNRVPADDGPRDDGQRPPLNSQLPQPGADGSFTRPDDGAPPGGGGGMFNIGQPGVLRFFTAPLSKETSWLLPFGLFSAVLLFAGARLRWPLAPEHQALVLWGGWLLISLAFFSVANFFHEYYLALLAPPLAVLVGVGVRQAWQLRQKRRWLATALLVLAVSGTIAFQLYTATAFTTELTWLPLVVGLLAVGAALLLFKPRMAQVGAAALVVAMLITPGVWSGLTTLNASANQSLPSAYGGRVSGPANQGREQLNQTLLDYLTANTTDTEYLLAVPSSMQGADYVITTGRPVLYLGGFNGQDEVADASDLAQMVADGELRYIYWDTSGGGVGGPGGGNANQADISAWVTSACSAVAGFESAARNAGAPDGNAVPTDGGGPGGNLRLTLYECGG
jgi:4-amino-4-deoxy-L-arabinose transferase-like glycosyltransferase